MEIYNVAAGLVHGSDQVISDSLPCTKVSLIDNSPEVLPPPIVLHLWRSEKDVRFLQLRRRLHVNLSISCMCLDLRGLLMIEWMSGHGSFFSCEAVQDFLDKLTAVNPSSHAVTVMRAEQ